MKILDWLEESRFSAFTVNFKQNLQIGVVLLNNDFEHIDHIRLKKVE